MQNALEKSEQAQCMNENAIDRACTIEDFECKAWNTHIARKHLEAAVSKPNASKKMRLAKRRTHHGK